MVRTQISLPEAQMRTLKRLAAQRRVSVATLIREGVELLIQTRAAKTGDEEKRRRALAAAGRFRSGHSDLAAEHDRYLVEAYHA